jgi:hypothetical protein
VSAALQIDTEVLIRADPARVWAILTDFPGYARWNPWIVSVGGTPTPGSDLLLQSVHVPGTRPTEGLVTLVSVEFPEMRWEGGHPDRSILKGEHVFRCEAAEGGCRFRHSEEFSGISAERLLMDVGARIRANFQLFNDALKRISEQ